MSDSEIDSSSDSDSEQFTMQPMREALKDLLMDLTGAIDSMKKVSKEIHQPTDLYEHLGIKSLLHKHLPIWKKEGRLSQNGSRVTLTEKEAKELDMFMSPSRQPLVNGEPVSVYEVCYRMLELCLEK
jgi:hypothetical protein